MEVMLGKIYLDKVKDTLQQVHDQYAHPFNNKRDDIEGHNFFRNSSRGNKGFNNFIFVL